MLGSGLCYGGHKRCAASPDNRLAQLEHRALLKETAAAGWISWFCGAVLTISLTRGRAAAQLARVEADKVTALKEVHELKMKLRKNDGEFTSDGKRCVASCQQAFQSCADSLHLAGLSVNYVLLTPPVAAVGCS